MGVKMAKKIIKKVIKALKKKDTGSPAKDANRKRYGA